MANKKISQLTSKSANLAATDLVEISEVSGSGYVSKRVSGQEIIGGVASSIIEDSITNGVVNKAPSENAVFDALALKVPYTGATGDVDLGEYELKAGQIELDQSPTGTAGVAVTRWNNTIGSTETTLKGGSVVLKNGVDLVARVVNKVTPNATLTKAAYQVVRVSGAQGQRLAVAYAQANNDNNSADTLGVVIETIPTNQEGFIMTVGQIEDINTTGSLQGETWADGDVLYLSPTIPGAITKVKPTGATGHIVIIGYVEYAHAVNGKIYVKIMNGWELDELHNVYINSGTLANNDALIYESSTQLWKNKTIATALGYTPVTNARTINTTAPLSGGGDLSADRTLSISDAAADGTTKGAATFTANDFNSASGVISLDYANGQKASGSQDGFLSQGDYSTFSGKQNALGFTPENVANKSNDTTLGGATPSTTLYPTQNAVKTYADNILGNANALVYKGVINCSTNPNYPAANAGELYIANDAGKIGGASGVDVEVGDMIICNTDGTASGDQATVGTNWNIIEKNISGAVSGPASSTSNNVAFFDGTTGKLIKDSGITLSGTNTGDETNLSIISKLGFTPEDVANKQSNLTASATKYPTVDAVNTGLSAKVSTGAITGSGLTMATSRLLGRTTAGTAGVEEISVGTGLTLSGGTLSAAPNVQSVSSAATVTPTASNDLVKITAQAVALTLAAPTGSPVEGQALMIRIKDNGTARAITWTSGTNGYRAIGVTLPTTTVLSKTTYVGLIYNSDDSRWDAIGVTTEA